MEQQLADMVFIQTPPVDDLAAAVRLIWPSTAAKDVGTRHQIVVCCLQMLEDPGRIDDGELFHEILLEYSIIFDVNQELFLRLRNAERAKDGKPQGFRI